MYIPRPHDISLPATASVDLTDHVRLALDVDTGRVTPAPDAREAA